jgi:AGZA family xanthine/uracil permease-like MFS transporter
MFKLKQHGSMARTEMIAGIATLLTIVYIVLVNPQILGAAGMDTQTVFIMTCLIAALSSIFMGCGESAYMAPVIDLNNFFVRYWTMANIPLSVRVGGITSGISLFIGIIGLKNIGIMVVTPDTP